jgi:hypothetical protein
LITLPVESCQAERWAGYRSGRRRRHLERDYDIGVKADGWTTAAEIGRRCAVPAWRVDRQAVPPANHQHRDRRAKFSLEGVYLEDETMKPVQLECASQ